MADGITQGSISNNLGYPTDFLDKDEPNGHENSNMPYPRRIRDSEKSKFEQLPDPADNKTSSGALVYTAHDDSSNEVPLKIAVAWKNTTTGPRMVQLAYTKIYPRSYNIDWIDFFKNLKGSSSEDSVGGVKSRINWNSNNQVPCLTITFETV